MRYILALATILFVSPALAGERYAIEMNDGTIAVMDLVQGTAQEAVDKWAPSEKAKVVSITKVEEVDLPTDRTFRNAWTFDKVQKKFGTDMVKAKDIWTKKLLRDREDKIKAVEKEVTDAEGIGDTQKANAAKSKLNDAKAPIPLSAIEAATTPEELKAVK